jgi:hypothetical protein
MRLAGDRARMARHVCGWTLGIACSRRRRPAGPIRRSDLPCRFTRAGTGRRRHLDIRLIDISSPLTERRAFRSLVFAVGPEPPRVRQGEDYFQDAMPTTSLGTSPAAACFGRVPGAESPVLADSPRLSDADPKHAQLPRAVGCRAAALPTSSTCVPVTVTTRSTDE